MKPNIVLITVDALRADYLIHNNSSTHPFLSSLMDKGIVFEKAVSSAGGTSPSFKGLFSELSPNHLRADYFYSIPRNVEFIPSELKKMGYHTIGVSNNPHLTRMQGYDRGFDDFYDGLSENKENKNEEEKDLQSKINDIRKKTLSFLDENLDVRLDRCKYLFGNVLALLNSRGYLPAEKINHIAKQFINNYNGDKPLFVWLHYMEVHSPYNLSNEYFSKINEKQIPLWERQWLRHQRHNFRKFSESELTEGDMEKIKILYKCGIKNLDEKIEDFYDFLDKKNLLKGTKFIVTSDHGEYFGEWDFLTHRFLYNSVLHVPLLFYDGDDKKRVKDVFSTFNLMDLIIDIIDDKSIDKSLREYTGHAISEAGGRTFTIQNKNYKIIKNTDTDETDLYKLVNFKEREIEKISPDDVSEITKLENILNEHIKKIKNAEKDKIKGTLKNIKI